MIIESEKEKEENNYINLSDGTIKDLETGQIFHYATHNRYTKDEENEDPNQPVMTRKYLDKILCTDFKEYYRTHELNEILYLHFKGFKKIDNLFTFTGLKCLYLEGNGIQKIEGLDNCVNLTSLYLHENCICKIEGLDKLEKLVNLNLSDNLITTIENLSNCKNLSNLLLKRNRIGENGLNDLKGLLELNDNFNVLDISDNKIKEQNIIEDYLTKIPNLRVIYLNGNDCVRNIKNYRKTLIAKLKEIRYIDDRPVFDDEKRFALAFAKGGYEEEKKERENYRREQREKEEKRIKDFYNMIHPNENQEKNEKKKMSEEEREKKKLEFLKSIKNKKQNDIFNDNDIGIMPQVKKEESEREIKKNVINEEKKEDDDIPQLETVNVLKNDINNNNDDELNIKVDEGVKINIKEQDLDELD
jgi:dynein assembly factor 1